MAYTTDTHRIYKNLLSRINSFREQWKDDVPVEVTGVLASIDLPLREVLGLKTGDVINLGQLGSVSLEVQNRSVGHGQFGVFDDKRSVKYGMTGLLDLAAGVTLAGAIDEALKEESDNE